MFSGYYQNRRVLVTGHTGFKGAWLSLWLKKLGAEVHGLSLPPPTNPNLHEIISASTFASETICDIRQLDALTAAIKKIQPQVVFHLAAQPIVRRSYVEPLETFETNARRHGARPRSHSQIGIELRHRRHHERQVL